MCLCCCVGVCVGVRWDKWTSKWIGFVGMRWLGRHQPSKSAATCTHTHACAPCPTTHALLPFHQHTYSTCKLTVVSRRQQQRLSQEAAAVDLLPAVHLLPTRHEHTEAERTASCLCGCQHLQHVLCCCCEDCGDKWRVDFKGAMLQVHSVDSGGAGRWDKGSRRVARWFGA